MGKYIKKKKLPLQQRGSEQILTGPGAEEQLRLVGQQWCESLCYGMYKELADSVHETKPNTR